MEFQTENSQDNKTEQTSSVAWYKLAELINRGEKEKALTFFRLLAHSFDEKAYALQLEGDILWSLEDKQALEKYQQAAFLYKKEKKLIQAISIYEHLLTLEPENSDFLISSIPYYVELDWSEKFYERFVGLINLHEQKKVSEETILALVRSVFELVNECEDKQRQKWVLKELKKLTKMLPANLAESIKNYL